MSNQFSLLKTRRFLPMFITQFFGALNDNFFKQSLILLITFQASAQVGNKASNLSVLTNLAAVLFILPFFLFSASAGQLADKFEKSKLVRYLKFAEICIMLIATIGFFLTNYWLLFFALFLMGVHSAFFGPIKYGILPQSLSSTELVGGNALFEMGTSLAILLGMMFSGILMSLPSHHIEWICFFAISFAGIGFAASHYVPAQPISQANITINWNIISSTQHNLKDVFKQKELFYSIIGISWFWYYGATFLTQIPQFTQQVLHGTPAVVTLLLTIFSVGIGIGSLLCERLTGHHNRLTLVPVGVVGLTLFAGDLFFSIQHITPTLHIQTITMILNNTALYRVLFDLFGVGLFGGFFIVPLYTFMQTEAPHTHRSRVIAANNVLNALFMVVSAIVAIVCLSILKLSLGHLFLMTAMLNALVGWIVIKGTSKN